MFTVICCLLWSGNRRTLSPLSRRYSVIPSTVVTSVGSAPATGSSTGAGTAQAPSRPKSPMRQQSRPLSRVRSVSVRLSGEVGAGFDHPSFIIQQPDPPCVAEKTIWSPRPQLGKVVLYHCYSRSNGIVARRRHLGQSRIYRLSERTAGEKVLAGSASEILAVRVTNFAGLFQRGQGIADGLLGRLVALYVQRQDDAGAADAIAAALADDANDFVASQGSSAPSSFHCVSGAALGRRAGGATESSYARRHCQARSVCVRLHRAC